MLHFACCGGTQNASGYVFARRRGRRRAPPQRFPEGAGTAGREKGTQGRASGVREYMYRLAEGEKEGKGTADLVTTVPFAFGFWSIDGRRGAGRGSLPWVGRGRGRDSILHRIASAALLSHLSSLLAAAVSSWTASSPIWTRAHAAG